MGVYVLKRKGYVDYDQVKGFVIIAKNYQHARELAEKHAVVQPREKGVWLDRKQTSCKSVNPAGRPGVVLRDFKAG